MHTCSPRYPYPLNYSLCMVGKVGTNCKVEDKRRVTYGPGISRKVYFMHMKSVCHKLASYELSYGTHCHYITYPYFGRYHLSRFKLVCLSEEKYTWTAKGVS